MTAYTYHAPCKLNLFLHITGRLPNGYHSLQSLFLLLDFGDEITITPRDDGTIVHLNPISGVPANQDLCMRAALALQKYSGCTRGAEIFLHKHTPMGGGLGGGSSDAATVLLALNQVWQLNYSRAQLMQIGLTLGADVPVFIFGQPAWAEGVGEKLTSVTLPESMWSKWFVVLTPQVQVSTAEIFAHQALTRDTKPVRIADFSSDANFAAFWQTVSNDMQDVVCALYPEVKQLLDWLSQFGNARMSGSGASIFLAVDTAEEAEKILSQRPKSTSGFYAKGLKCHPHFLLLKT